MRTAYTPEEKRAHFTDLRKAWAANKAKADQDNDARARYEAVLAEAPGFRMSYYSFHFTLIDMRAQGLSGLPYIDAKTFDGWRAAGHIVRKGEHAKIHGITWMRASSKNAAGEYIEDADAPLYPKSYALFHTSQVDPR